MDLITQLLKLSLLEAVGDDPQRADKLRAAAATLAGRLAADERGAVPSAVLAAVEPGEGDCALEGSVFALAQQALLAEWETLPNAFPETPRELLRAVLLSAVAQAAEQDASVRLGGWYTLRSGLEQSGGGRWAPVLEAAGGVVGRGRLGGWRAVAAGARYFRVACAVGEGTGALHDARAAGGD